MLSEITSCLQLSSLSNDALILVTKDFMSDVNFIFSEILSHCLKNNYTVILLNFVQSCPHYNHVLLKSDVNVRQLRENHQILTIDGLAEIEKLTNSIPLETEQSTAFKSLFSGSAGTECVQKLYSVIKETVRKLNEESKPFVLFIDDVTTLLNLGLEIKYICLLVQYCRSLCCSGGQIPNILLIGSTHDNDDSANERMINYLLHLADIKIQIDRLKTGYSKDYHGKISLNVRNPLEGTSSKQKMLYKVTEKGATLFSLGL